jgi:hypothetical protein
MEFPEKPQVQRQKVELSQIREEDPKGYLGALALQAGPKGLLLLALLGGPENQLEVLKAVLVLSETIRQLKDSCNP